MRLQRCNIKIMWAERQNLMRTKGAHGGGKNIHDASIRHVYFVFSCSDFAPVKLLVLSF